MDVQLQEKPSTLKREHPAIFLTFFYRESLSPSWIWIRIQPTKSIADARVRIRICNTGLVLVIPGKSDTIYGYGDSVCLRLVEKKQLFITEYFPAFCVTRYTKTGKPFPHTGKPFPLFVTLSVSCADLKNYCNMLVSILLFRSSFFGLESLSLSMQNIERKKKNFFFLNVVHLLNIQYQDVSIVHATSHVTVLSIVVLKRKKM